eukprot:TRINITY_DN5467_c0_g3_i4.p1 TRINITY_DN5467_c0_g3~~TRINITY_DN5467_c0_g3_i4.p1  ORF type:complete len:283 (-),score=45.70 TRINITY_DN5467_c0_g3_i4:36-884(-)
MSGNKADPQNGSHPGPIFTRFIKHEIRDNSTVEYTMLVTEASTKESWTIVSRYSQFREVHKQLKTLAKGKLPKFPPKKLFGNTDSTFIFQRQKALENYFNVVLADPFLSKLQPLQHFILQNHNKTIKRTTTHKDNKGERDGGSVGAEESKNQGTLAKDERVSERERREAVEKELNEITNLFAQKMIDLTSVLDPPDQEEFEKKRALYHKHLAGTNFPKAHRTFRFPSPIITSVQHLDEPTLVRNQDPLFSNMEKLVGNFRMKVNLLDFVRDEESRNFVHVLQ